MSDFKVGDKVWFFWSPHFTHSDDVVLLMDDHVNIKEGKIIWIRDHGGGWQEHMHVYCDGKMEIWDLHCEKGAHKSKSEAINAMIERLETLRNEE